MKAIEINSEIKIYNNLPKSWGNIIGGFDTLTDTELEEYGFYNIIKPDYDNQIQELSEIYFDQEQNVFTYNIINKTWLETLEELKEDKIINLKGYIKDKLNNTDWYYIRKLQRNIDVPIEIQEERDAILVEHDNHIEAINVLLKKEDVVKYEFK